MRHPHVYVEEGRFSDLAVNYQIFKLSDLLRMASVQTFLAKGSAGEVRSQLYVASDLGYLAQKNFEKLNHSALFVSRQLSGFIKYLNRAAKTAKPQFDNLKT